MRLSGTRARMLGPLAPFRHSQRAPKRKLSIFSINIKIRSDPKKIIISKEEQNMIICFLSNRGRELIFIKKNYHIEGGAWFDKNIIIISLESLDSIKIFLSDRWRGIIRYKFFYHIKKLIDLWYFDPSIFIKRRPLADTNILCVIPKFLHAHKRSLEHSTDFPILTAKGFLSPCNFFSFCLQY